ncbi:unnamed protein product [Penicillium olsonii]|nr:unnamed protein product [Penicillium olsonii]CAG7933933.1 unnamed protein product [Penicillium olsonii]
MTRPISLKTDPLGSLDTRLAMAEPSAAKSCLGPSATVFGLEGAAEEPPGSMQSGISPNRDYRTLELRESFGAFDVGQQCPRLELDAAVNKCHLLNGLAGPSNPQNTPASNSARECTPEPLQYGMKDLQASPAFEFNNYRFGSFNNLPEKGFFAPRDDDAETSKPQKLRRPFDNQRRALKLPLTGLRGRCIITNRSAMRKPGNPGLVRYVRFGATTSLSCSPPHVTCRLSPSIERKRNYISTYRQKRHCEKWRIARRPTPRKPSPICNSTLEAQIMGNMTPKQADGFDRSLSSSPLHGFGQMPSPARSYNGTHALDGTFDSPQNTPAVRNSKAPRGNQKKKMYVNISFSLYKVHSAPGALPGKVRQYAYEFRKVETDFTSLSGYLPLDVPYRFEKTTGLVAVNDLVFRTYFIIPSRVISLPLDALSTATQYLNNTQVGYCVFGLARIIRLLLTYAIAFVCSLCGVTIRHHRLADVRSD